LLKYFRIARELQKLTHENLFTTIKTIYGTIIRALLCTVYESTSQRDVQIYGVSSPGQSLYRMSCPLIARTNTLLTTFVVNVPWSCFFTIAA